MATLTTEPASYGTFYIPKKTRVENDFKELMSLHEYRVGMRTVWDSLFQDIRELVRPNAEDFTRFTVPGQNRELKILKNTPAKAHETLVGGASNVITNQWSRWFEVLTKDVQLNKQPEVLEFLEETSEAIYEVMRDTETQWKLAMNEMYSDLFAFGTSAIFEYWNEKRNLIHFKTIPLAEFWIDENEQCEVDTLDHKCEYSTRNAIRTFGDKTPKKILDEKNKNKVWNFIHFTYPREDRDTKNPMAREMAFASVWVCVESKDVVDISGFKDFPYQVPRLNKVPGEIYGRSPAMAQLQNIKTLNAMVKVMLQSSQLQAAPPLLYEDENVIGKINLAPYELIATMPGSENAVRPLQIGGRLDVNIEMIRMYADEIKEGFYNDLFTLPDTAGRDRVTATEFSESRAYQLRQLSGIFGRIDAELLQPQIKRTHSILVDKSTPFRQLVPDMPPSMDGAVLDLNFMSPAAMAQRGAKTANIQQFMNDLIPLAQIKPDVFDVIDIDATVQDVAILRNVSRKLIRSEDEIGQIRDGRKQQQMMLQAAQAAPELAGAAKDLSVAAKNAPQMMGGLG